MNASVGASVAFGWKEGWRYGLMGLPLAFVALPLYVVLPNYYALHYGVPLAALGTLLLGARLLDAIWGPAVAEPVGHQASNAAAVRGAAALLARRGYADDANLMKTALYDFHVEHGGARRARRAFCTWCRRRVHAPTHPTTLV